MMTETPWNYREAEKMVRNTFRRFLELYPDLHIDLKVRNINTCQQSYYKEENRHSICAGMRLIRWFWENGYRCRPRVRCWNYHESASLRGVETTFRLILHELAHVLQTEIPGGRVKGVMHGSIYYECLRKLIKDIPYRGIKPSIFTIQIQNVPIENVISNARLTLQTMFYSGLEHEDASIKERNALIFQAYKVFGNDPDIITLSTKELQELLA